jgi:hypothetical protein
MRRVQFLTLPYFSWSVASLPGPGNNIGLEQVVRRRRHYQPEVTLRKAKAPQTHRVVRRYR